MFGPHVSIIFVPTLSCNCDCEYCFEEKQSGHTSLKDLAALFERIASYLARCGSKDVDVYWQGGEILVLPRQWCLDAGQRINTIMRGHGLGVSQFLQTNLMGYEPLWDEVIWSLFDGLLGSSLDFPNVHRTFRGVSGDRYNDLWAERYREAVSRGIEASVISVINQETLLLPAEEFYRYYVRELGIRSLQVNTPFAAGPSRGLSHKLLLDAAKLGDFFVELLDIWLSRDDGVTISPFQAIIDAMTRGPAHANTPCFFCPNCVNGFFCVGPKGDVAQCDAWLGSYPERNFGNLLETDDVGKILLSPERMTLARRPADVISATECPECPYFPLCHGGCAVRTQSAKGSLAHSDPYCETYKRMFAALEQHVRTPARARKGWKPVRSGLQNPKKLVWGWPEPGAVVFSSFECTNNCIFCAPAYDRSKNPADLDEEVFNFILQCARNGTRTLFFTGAGEPTLNPSLPEYVRFARAEGIEHFFMFTNGHGITEELVASLKDAGMENFWVSLHGLGATHDRIVRRKGSFVEAYRALKIIDEAEPQRLNVNTCLNGFNLPEIEKLMDQVLKCSRTTAHCLCLPEWDGNAYVYRDKMCRLADVKERLARISVEQYPITILDNIPHCVAPHLPHIGNVRNDVRIKRRDSDAMVSNADNMGHNRTPHFCIQRKCPHIDLCVGVDSRYLEEYGEDEICSL
jgi:radical SAM protein with 4Fe4S-binding SPASM domain